MPHEATSAPGDASVAAVPAMDMQGIGKQFPGVVALADVDLTLAPGRVHALMGENGAGKSTLIKILAGVYQKDSGEIRIGSQAVEIRTPGDALRLGIKVVFQEIALIPEFTVAENIFLEEHPVGRFGSVDWRRLRRQAGALFDRPGLRGGPGCARARFAAQHAANGGDRPGAGARGAHRGDGRTHLLAHAQGSVLCCSR